MLILLAILVVLIVVGHQAAKASAAKIQSNPDPFPYDVLKKEPQGTEAIITREDGTKIRAISAGTGPTVVLAHGYGYSLLEWSIIFTKLIEAGHRVIVFDQRGHGQSTIGTEGIGSTQMAGDYKAVLEHFDVRDAVLVGHSMGGFLSIAFLLNYPEIARERLKGVVLFAATAGSVLKGSVQNRFQLPLIQMGIIQRVAGSGVYGWLFGASLYGDQPAPSGIRIFLEIFNAQNHYALIPILKALADEDYYPRLHEIQLPTVVICGKKDKTTPPWHSESMGKNIPNARSVWVEGKGHLLNWEAPDSLVDAVRSLTPEHAVS